MEPLHNGEQGRARTTWPVWRGVRLRLILRLLRRCCRRHVFGRMTPFPFTAWFFLFGTWRGRLWRGSFRWRHPFDLPLFMVVVRCTNGFLKVSLYSHDLNLDMHCIFDKLCNGNHETLLSHDNTNDWAPEHGRIGEVAQPRFQNRSSDVHPQSFWLARNQYVRYKLTSATYPARQSPAVCRPQRSHQRWSRLSQ